MSTHTAPTAPSHPRAPSHHRGLALVVTALVAIGLARLPRRVAATPPAQQVVTPSQNSPQDAGARSARGLDPNVATRHELESLPGIGPALAARIVAARPFRRVEDLTRVRGIGPRTLERLRPRIEIPTDAGADVTDPRSSAAR